MKQADIKNLKKEEIIVLLSSNKQTYNKLKLSHKVSPIQNPIQIRDLRRTIARLETALGNFNND